MHLSLRPRVEQDAFAPFLAIVCHIVVKSNKPGQNKALAAVKNLHSEKIRFFEIYRLQCPARLHKFRSADGEHSTQTGGNQGKAPVAQLDRASDYESEGRRFESFRARHSKARRYRVGPLPFPDQNLSRFRCPVFRNAEM